MTIGHKVIPAYPSSQEEDMAVAALLEDFHDSERHGDNDQRFEKLLVIGQQLCQFLYCGSAFQNDGIAGVYHVIGGLGDPLFLGQIMGGTGGKGVSLLL